MSQWQDISTAPKDRTPMLLLSPDQEVGIGYLEVSRYDDVEFLSGSAAWVGQRKHDRVASVWLGGWKAEEATHWMPLPPAPEAQP